MTFSESVVRYARMGLKVLAFTYLFDKFALPNDKVKKSTEGLE